MGAQDNSVANAEATKATAIEAPRLSIIVPTFNEAHNVPHLVAALGEAFGSTGWEVVFVDDDNVLAPDYLEQAVGISSSWPILGAWSGQCHPEFETQPPEWTRRYWPSLAIREFNNDRWSNQAEEAALPWGAGLCVRSSCAQAYADLVKAQFHRRSLDRRGKLLISGGDTDLALSVCELGFGTGVFSRLELTHLIPAFRLTEEYLLKLVEGSSFTRILLDHARKKARRPSLPSAQGGSCRNDRTNLASPHALRGGRNFTGRGVRGAPAGAAHRQRGFASHAARQGNWFGR